MEDYPLNKKSIDLAKHAIQFAKAVSHPDRETMLAIITHSPNCTVEHITQRLGRKMAQPNVSMHLRILKKAKLVTSLVNKDNKRQTFYSTNMDVLKGGMQAFSYFEIMEKPKKAKHAS